MKRKSVFSAVLTIALVLALAFTACASSGSGSGSGSGSSIDNVTIGSWEWTTFDDSRANADEGGKSTVTMTQGTDNKLTFTGKVIKGYAYPYIGISVEPNATELAKLQTANSISFKVKGGKAATYQLMLVTSDITDYSFFRKSFPVSTTETTVTINISDLIPANWGGTSNSETIGTIDKSKAMKIQIQSADAFSGSFTLTISDLKLDND